MHDAAVELEAMPMVARRQIFLDGRSIEFERKQPLPIDFYETWACSKMSKRPETWTWLKSEKTARVLHAARPPFLTDALNLALTSRPYWLRRSMLASTRS